MGFKRRTFLQQTGLVLLTLMGENGLFSPKLKGYLQALSEPTPRKLALLVGINNYSQTKNLSGCLTDVELQRELLIHRFGFNPSDIITLTDQQATRENIETAFVEHLLAQAKVTDVVVFHFSGYGSLVKKPQSSDKPIASLVPVEGILSGETLELLARSLDTEKLTMILDTSYKSTGALLKGNWRVRSFPNVLEEFPPEELAFQLQLNSQNGSPIPGIILSAAKENQIATEAVWNGFSAGLFTYALTQYLWQVTPASTVQIAATRAAEMVESFMGKQQQPQLIGKSDRLVFAYHLFPDQQIGAEGIITVQEDNSVFQIQLIGIPATVLSNLAVNSCFTVAPIQSSSEFQETLDKLSTEVRLVKTIPPDTFLQIRSREGLRAKTKFVNRTETTNTNPPQVGQLVQELIRVFPRNLGLNVALDANLERIERVDATSAFASIAAVSSVVAPGEQAADYLFGISKKRTKVTSDSVTPASETINASAEKGLEGYGLFSAGGVPIPNTIGPASEAIKSAVRRLVPKLETLLAAKLWRLSVNEGSSSLGIKATLEIINQNNQALLQRETLRHRPYSQQKSLQSYEDDLLAVVDSGSQIQYRIENNSDHRVYLVLLGIDSGGNAIGLYSPEVKSEPDSNGTQYKLKDRVIAPGEILIVPEPSASLNWIVSGPAGIAQTQIICAIEPLANTLKVLAAAQHPKGEKEQVLDLVNPLEVARALLEDLHFSSAVPGEFIASTSDIYALDVNAWANLSFIYQVS